jgi:cytochrome b involved in lipid metabolism
MGNCNFKRFTLNELIEENKKYPRYILIDNCIYDIQSILNKHPGGFNCLSIRCITLENCKEDYIFHSSVTKKKWNTLLVGKLN